MTNSGNLLDFFTFYLACLLFFLIFQKLAKFFYFCILATQSGKTPQKTKTIFSDCKRLQTTTNVYKCLKTDK